MATARPRATNPGNDDGGDVDPFFSTLESVMRISLAGFGGALAGMSLARRGASVVASAPASAIARRVANSPFAPPPGTVLPAAAAPDAAAKTKNGGAKAGAAVAAVVSGSGKRRLQRRQTIVRASPPPAALPHRYSDRELPTAWAVACAAFAGVVEFVRAASPSTVVRDLLLAAPPPPSATMGGGYGDGYGGGEEERRTTTTATTPVDDDDGDDDGGDGIASSAHGWSIVPPDPSALCAISDYAIGGAVAGAVFRGSAVRTRLGARGMSSAVGGGGRRPFLSGILPGAVLGLSAGIAIVALDRGRILLDERYGVRPDPRRGDDDDGDDDGDDDDDCATGDSPSFAASPGHGVGADAQIPADIRAMSNEELARSIESLRRGEDAGGGGRSSSSSSHSSSSSSSAAAAEPSRLEKVGATTDDEGGEETRDLFSAIGFRPHPSRGKE